MTGSIQPQVQDPTSRIVSKSSAGGMSVVTNAWLKSVAVGKSKLRIERDVITQYQTQIQALQADCPVQAITQHQA